VTAATLAAPLGMAQGPWAAEGNVSSRGRVAVPQWRLSFSLLSFGRPSRQSAAQTRGGTPLPNRHTGDAPRTGSTFLAILRRRM
jgi:hypothetical protein